MPTLSKAIDNLNNGRYEDAVIILQNLRDADPDDPDVLYNLGMAYSDMGLLDKAVATLTECIYKRGNANDHTALGMAYQRRKQDEKALEQFERALEIEPSNIYALKNYAAMLGTQGKFEEARDAFARAAESKPLLPEVAYGLGYAYEKTGDLEHADEWYQKTLAIPGEHNVSELAKQARTRIAQGQVKSHGTNMGAMFYCLDALEKFQSMSREDIQMVAAEVAILGQSGLDINNSEKKYQLKTLPGTYSGLHALCFMFVGFKIIEPTLDAGIDLNDEYQVALQMHKGRQA